MSFRTTLVLTVTVAGLSLAACSGGSDDAERGASEDRAPEASTSPQSSYDTTWEVGRTTFSDEAINAVGRKEAQAAADQIQALARDYAFDSDLMLSAAETNRNLLFAVSDQMTNDARSDWEAAVEGYLANRLDEESAGTLYGLSFVEIHPSGVKFDGKPVKAPRSGPGAVNLEIDSTKVSLLSDNRLQVDISAQADLRIRVGSEPRLWHFTRTNSYYLEKSGDTWLIDGWNHQYKQRGTRAEP